MIISMRTPKLSRSRSALYGLGLLVATSCLANARAATPPNVIIFLADDLGAMDVGYYNPHTFYETPNLDRLAREGMRFTAAYAANPVCSPTRYSMLTGRYPTRAQLTNWLPGVRTEKFQGAELATSMPLAETTLAEALQAAGYRTAYVGKWHLGEDASHWPEAQGFEINVGGYSAGAPASFFPPYKNPRLADGPAGEHLSTRLAEESARLIQQFRREGKPFLLIHADYAVHNPLEAPPELIEKYRRKAEALGLQNEFGTETQYHLSANGPRRVRLAQNHAAYAALVELMDAAVGRLLQELEQQGIANNTLVIFASDNGGLSTNEGGGRRPAAAAANAAPKAPARGERAVPMPTSNLPLRAGKGWLYEGGLRNPLVVRWPGVTAAGATCAVPVMTIDFMPTALAAAGTSVPTALDGRDLAPLLRGEPDRFETRELFWHYPHYSNQGGFPGGGVLAGQWKLLENYEDGSVMLFDLSTDAAEKHDLAATQPARVNELRKSLHDWYSRVDAQFLRAAPGGPAPWRP